MSFRISRASSRRAQPWTNGGGSTIEIAVGPEDADLSHFDWRISVASVDTDGPFSVFPGIDRTLCILEGDGVVLHGPELLRMTVTPTSEPAVFSGDVPIHCTLLAHAVTDLNIMTRRGRFRHAVERLRMDSRTLNAERGQVFLFATDHTTLLTDDGTSCLLGPRDMARIDGHGPVKGEGRGDCYVITVLPEA